MEKRYLSNLSNKEWNLIKHLTFYKMRELRKAFFLIISIFLCAFEIEASPNDQEFMGLLFVEPFYGPTGYGDNPENDMIEEAYILKLDRKEEATAFHSGENPGEGKLEVERIHLGVTTPLKAELNKYIGQRLKVTVKELSVAETGHHHAPVVGDIKTFTPLMTKRYEYSK